MNEQILIADSNESFTGRLRALLQQRGFRVLTADTVAMTFDRFAFSGPFDVLVVGDVIGNLLGEELLETLRSIKQMPAALLKVQPTMPCADVDRRWGEIKQARDVADRINSFFGLRITEVYPLRLGPLIIDPENHDVEIYGKRIGFTLRETEVLYYFVAHSGELVTREDLFASVWGKENTVKKKIVDSYVKRLRAKCRAETKEIAFRTVSHMGYQLRLLTLPPSKDTPN